MELLKQKDSEKTAVLEEIASIESQLVHLQSPAEEGEIKDDSELHIIEKLLKTKKSQLEEISMQMRELGDSMKAAKEEASVAESVPGPEPEPVVEPVAVAAEVVTEVEAETVVAPESVEPLVIATETPSPAPESVSPVASPAPAAASPKAAKTSGKVVPRKAKSTSAKKSSAKTIKDSKAAKTPAASSSALSEYTSKFMTSCMNNGIMALQIGMQHRSVFLFGISAACIYAFGEYASI